MMAIPIAFILESQMGENAPVVILSFSIKDSKRDVVGSRTAESCGLPLFISRAQDSTFPNFIAFECLNIGDRIRNGRCWAMARVYKLRQRPWVKPGELGNQSLSQGCS